MSDTIRVGYEILLEVGIDPATGKVVDVTAYSQEANTVLPIHVYHDVDGYLWSVDENTTDRTESLARAENDNPRVKWAHDIASGISIGMPNEGGRGNIPFDQAVLPETPYAAAPDETVIAAMQDAGLDV